MSTTMLTTAEELARMPRDEFRYELVRGELQQMSPAGFEHCEIESTIARHLGNHVKKHKLGSVLTGDPGFKIASNPDTVRAPDVAFVSHERIGLIADKTAFAPIAPDLAIEILSPTDSPSKLTSKIEQWLQAGTLAVIMINPRRRTATVYQPGGIVSELTESQAIELPAVVPGWTMTVREVFE